MKKTVYLTGAVLLVCSSMLCSMKGYAEEQSYQEVKPGVFSVAEEPIADSVDKVENVNASSYFLDGQQKLTAEEQAVVTYIEQYLTEYLRLHPASRGLVSDVIDRAVIELAFDTAFKRDSVLFSLINGLTGTSDDDKAYADWYKSLSNTSERSQTVFDVPTGKNIQLYSRYIDNGSDQTVVVHSGYRDTQNSNLTHVKMFSDMGYNVLIPDTRSHGDSEGDYITFGYYEQQDLTGWIDQEVQLRNDQEIILFGLSMGASTTMLSQATPHPSVAAYIEDCGYYSVEQQFHDILGLFTQFFKYIPLVKDYDWEAKEDQLIYKLNEEKTKPILQMDLYTVNPVDSVSKTGVPKLFIHGDADWFVPTVAQEVLYNHAAGYKERLTIAGAGHGQSIYTDEALYTATVQSFLTTVENMTTKNPVIAPDSNLLRNPTLETSATNVTDWKTSTDGQTFTSGALTKNGFGEFVLKKTLLLDAVTMLRTNEGLRIFNRQYDNVGFLGQDIAVHGGETYELSFSAKNDTDAAVTYPNVLYSIADVAMDEGLNETLPQKKQLLYQAPTDGDVTVKLGAKLGYKSLISRDYTFTTLSNVQVVNADRTPPEPVTITDITPSESQYIISGTGESNSSIVAEDQEGNILTEIQATENGAFQLSIPKDHYELIHIINKDFKGNQSESRVILFQ